MTIETLTEAQMLPKEVELHRCNRWILESDFIESFMLKEIIGPTIVPNQDTCEITLIVYNELGGYNSHRIISWLKACEMAPMVVKFLDSVGSVVDQWVFDARPTKVEFSKLTYHSTQPTCIHVTLNVENFEVGFKE